MAMDPTTNQKGNSPPPAAAAPKKRAMPAGLVNLAERYPQYEPGVDSRDIKKNFGKDGNLLHGYFLGELMMPATIEDDETGEKKPWIVLCFELLEPCEGRYQDDDNPDRVQVRTAPAGSKMIMTKTTALESILTRVNFAKAQADHPDKVFEFYIRPQVGKTQGGRALWLFPEFGVGNPTPRQPRHNVTLALAGPPAPKQIGSGE